MWYQAVALDFVQALFHDMQGMGSLHGSFSDWKVDDIVQSWYLFGLGAGLSVNSCQWNKGLLLLCGFILKIVV